MHKHCSQKIGCLNASITRIGDGLNASITRIGDGLNVVCGLVCDTIQKDRIVKVSPEYIFLNKSNNFSDDVYVISNVVWEVN